MLHAPQNSKPNSSNKAPQPGVSSSIQLVTFLTGTIQSLESPSCRWVEFYSYHRVGVIFIGSYQRQSCALGREVKYLYWGSPSARHRPLLPWSLSIRGGGLHRSQSWLTFPIQGATNLGRTVELANGLECPSLE